MTDFSDPVKALNEVNRMIRFAQTNDIKEKEASLLRLERLKIKIEEHMGIAVDPERKAKAVNFVQVVDKED